MCSYIYEPRQIAYVSHLDQFTNEYTLTLKSIKGTYHAFKSFIFTYKSYICGLYKA